MYQLLTAQLRIFVGLIIFFLYLTPNFYAVSLELHITFQISPPNLPRQIPPPPPCRPLSFSVVQRPRKLRHVVTMDLRVHERGVHAAFEARQRRDVCPWHNVDIAGVFEGECAVVGKGSGAAVPGDFGDLRGGWGTVGLGLESEEVV